MSKCPRTLVTIGQVSGVYRPSNAIESNPTRAADYHGVDMPGPLAQLQPRHRRRRGLTMLETVLSISLIAVLLSILLPALSLARAGSYRDRCQFNQQIIGEAWHNYLADHNQQFPTVPVQPGWFYAGMRFSAVGDQMWPDADRPLTAYCHLFRTTDVNEVVCYCPADHGITDPLVSVGTGRRTAFRSFGTSYRANSALVGSPVGGEQGERRGLNRNEITTVSSRLVVMGDPVWYEVAESTGRQADWHGEPNAGNILFLDGSVRFTAVRPRNVVGPVVFDPKMRGSMPDPAPETPAADE